MTENEVGANSPVGSAQRHRAAGVDPATVTRTHLILCQAAGPGDHDGVAIHVETEAILVEHAKVACLVIPDRAANKRHLRTLGRYDSAPDAVTAIASERAIAHLEVMCLRGRAVPSKSLFVLQCIGASWSPLHWSAGDLQHVPAIRNRVHFHERIEAPSPWSDRQ